jgi:hypothetical protein
MNSLTKKINSGDRTLKSKPKCKQNQVLLFKAVGKAARVPMNDAKKQEMELAKRLTQETALLKSRINSDVKQSEIMSKEMKNRMV